MTLVLPAAQATIRSNATTFAQYIGALALAKGDPMHAERIFKDRHPRSLFVQAVERAAVTAATTNDPVWAGPLAPLDPLGSAFADSDEVARVYRYEVARGFRDDVAHLSDLISPGGEAF